MNSRKNRCPVAMASEIFSQALDQQVRRAAPQGGRRAQGRGEGEGGRRGLPHAPDARAGVTNASQSISYIISALLCSYIMMLCSALACLRVQPHLGKCFEGIGKLIFEGEKNIITGMQSAALDGAGNTDIADLVRLCRGQPMGRNANLGAPRDTGGKITTGKPLRGELVDMLSDAVERQGQR